jgi:hypothetical protein
MGTKPEGEHSAFTKPIDSAKQTKSESLVHGIYESHTSHKTEALKDGKVEAGEQKTLNKENDTALHKLRENYKGVLDERYTVQGYAKKDGESKLLVSDKKEKGAVFVVDSDTGKIEGKYKKDASGKLVEDLEFKKNLKEGPPESKPGVHRDNLGRIDDVQTNEGRHWHMTYKGNEKEPSEVKYNNGYDTVTYTKENGKYYETSKAGKQEIQNFKVDEQGDLSVTHKFSDNQSTTQYFKTGGVKLHETYNDKHENMIVENGYHDKRAATWDANGNLDSVLLHEGKRVNVTTEKTSGGKPIFEDETHHKFTVSVDKESGVISYSSLDANNKPMFTSTAYPDGRVRTFDHANQTYSPGRPPYEKPKQ